MVLHVCSYRVLLQQAHCFAMDGASRCRGKGGSKKTSSDIAKKKGISGKGQASLEWTPAGTNNWTLSRKGENLEEYGRARDPETAIIAGTLYARAASNTTLELGTGRFSGDIFF